MNEEVTFYDDAMPVTATGDLEPNGLTVKVSNVRIYVCGTEIANPAPAMIKRAENELCDWYATNNWVMGKLEGESA